MPAPISFTPTQAAYLDALEDRLAALENLQSPRAPYACAVADLPAAADFYNCLAYVTDTKILVVSDGTDWRRQDTGAAI